ncbi:MAG TPA: hypothetical protein VF169_01290 [Albitalea sp.]
MSQLSLRRQFARFVAAAREKRFARACQSFASHRPPRLADVKLKP